MLFDSTFLLKNITISCRKKLLGLSGEQLEFWGHSVLQTLALVNRVLVNQRVSILFSASCMCHLKDHRLYQCQFLDHFVHI